MIPRRALALGGALALLAGSAMADPPAPAAADGAPVSTASQSTDAKIAAWLDDSKASKAKDADDAGPDIAPPQSDGKIHGEVGAAVGSHGYRSAYGVATIPLGKSSSVTVAVSTGRGGYPWVAGAPWAVGPAGPGVRASCVCREAP